MLEGRIIGFFEWEYKAKKNWKVKVVQLIIKHSLKWDLLPFCHLQRIYLVGNTSVMMW